VKRNGILLLIFFSLLTVIYIFEESSNQKKINQEYLKTRAFYLDLTNIKTIKWNHFEVHLRDGEFVFLDSPSKISRDKLMDYIETLKKIKIERELQGLSSEKKQDLMTTGENHFIEVHFLDGRKRILFLGKRHSISEQFYLRRESENGVDYFLARDDRPFPSMYKEGEDYYQARYFWIKTVFSPKRELFLLSLSHD